MPKPDHKLHVEEMLDAAVEQCGCAEERKPAYRAFAREFLLSLESPPSPDYSGASKQVVMKWFNRGLSGRSLYLIGRALTHLRFPCPEVTHVHRP